MHKFYNPFTSLTIFKLRSTTEHMPALVRCNQGDQIGRIFDDVAIAYNWTVI
jgi:hypothetical protein